MKYLKYLIVLLFVPFIVIAEECDISKIIITSMEQNNIEGNTEVIKNPTFQDRSINLNLKMYEVGDSITYDMTIKNDSDEDYIIDEDTFKTDSDYIEYTLKTNDNSNVIKAKSSKGIILIVEYKKEVDSSLLNNNRFDASNSLKLSLNTNDKEKPLDVITTDNIKESLAPQEVKNPLTNVNNIKLMIIFSLVIIAIIYLTIHNKKKYNKYIILLLSILVIPTIYAICKCDIEVESTIEIVSSQTINKICRKATELHTTTCKIYGFGYKGCNIEIGYGNMITYGTIVDGSLKGGDAFDCDVNSDGIYDAENERFYYITSDQDKAVLIYYRNINDQEEYPYDLSGESYHGPVTGYQYLPSTTEWNNDDLILPGTRQIVSSNGSPNTGAANIDIFTYEGKAARFLTYQELTSVCGDEGVTNQGYLDSCNYLMENINQYEIGNGGSNGYWLESPAYSTNSYAVWQLACYERKLFSFPPSFSNGVRPVIEVLTTDIDY